MAIRKHIPNAMTCGNLLCGCLAIRASFCLEFKAALLLIIGAAVFDFFDGMVARLLKVSSPIGKELDSLADMVSFGAAPAFICFNFMALIGAGNVLTYVTLLLAAFSALRLAKFNIDTRQSENFIGLATPASALLLASLIEFSYQAAEAEAFWRANAVLLGVLVLAIAFLLTSEIPMFSLKFKSLGFTKNKVRFVYLGLTAAIVAVCVVFRLRFSVAIFAALALYLIMNLGIFAVKRSKICCFKNK